MGRLSASTEVGSVEMRLGGTPPLLVRKSSPLPMRLKGPAPPPSNNRKLSTNGLAMFWFGARLRLPTKYRIVSGLLTGTVLPSQLAGVLQLGSEASPVQICALAGAHHASAAPRAAAAHTLLVPVMGGLLPMPSLR